MNHLFIGREKEQQLLKEFIASDQSEFITVYGRRRVGKTFLIQQVIGENYAFYVAGMDRVSMRIQLANFMQGIIKKQPNTPIPKTWLEAFVALENYLEALPSGPKIIFIDEMPWMDTPRSNFISGLEHFWNSWASWRNDVKLIVCGSATSWIINNLIKNRGGLHNRVTHKILLKPFTLRECQLYFSARGFRLSTKQIAECYMVTGGVPFYLSKMNKGEGVAQNIDRLFFAEDGELHDEFLSLYNSLYKNAASHIKIVTTLASRGKGLTRQEILEKTKLPDNGRFSMMLQELESCGFIRSYEPYLTNKFSQRKPLLTDHQSTKILYQLVDHFTLFYFQVMRKAGSHDPNYWSNNQNTHVFSTWSGLSFEMLCLNHSEQIKAALGISGINTNVFSWFGKGEKRAAQIDMLIDRADNTINICEMKYSSQPFVIDKACHENLRRKVAVFAACSKRRYAARLTLITAAGIASNTYRWTAENEVTLDDLFK